MWPFSSNNFPTLAPEQAGVPFAQPLPTSNEATYDYILVGGGTAGSCLASRLSEGPNVTVLLLERGGVADSWADRVPLISSNPYRAGAPVGRWWSQPLPKSRSAEGRSRSLEVVCGETLGGTSAINSTFYTRGPAGDYNRWQELGNEGWGYADLEPYFAKSENAHSHPESRYRGKTGSPWHNRTYHNNVYKHTQHVIRAAERTGITAMEDLNSPMAPAVGYVRHDVSQDPKARRHGPFHAFLPPALVRARTSRLKICTNALATRLEFASDESGNIRVVGVHFEVTDYRYAGRSFFARARREVIVCSGAVGSPQLLQLSGLGPRDLLEAKGIPVVRDMPGVGSFLQDHVAVPLTFEAPMNDSLHELEASPLKVIRELATYIVSGGGLLSYPFQAVTLYVPSRLLDKDSTISVADKKTLDTGELATCPDLEIMPAANNCTDHDIPGKGMFTFIVGLIRPKSFGSVRLATSNPRARPEVDLGFLTNSDDLIPLRKGIKLGMRLAKDMRDQGYPLKNLIVPESTDDSSLDAFISQNIRTCYHYTSTCRMGQAGDSEHPAVVDSELRVHGVQGLRVCDASVFPEIIGGHTMAPVVMVAEKCADLIKNTYRTGAA
ncbi:GMC oxidoreductase [Trametes coccinea BRFM310]|uniref:GMC oxidoreductase n=1 Tax=Trametes coccinea (strain BRFM310) TaxID=1353009 RepID=A0A1Y2IX14_TRAC3|nr:GMC oxidoreductase [Trametes coccinea BRFM310]